MSKGAFAAATERERKMRKDAEAVLEQLVASQVREEKLRSALENIYATSNQLETMEISAEALALPSDDAAMQQRLAQERERCAKACEQGLCNRPNDPPANYFDGGLRHCASAIRSMK